MGLKKNKLTCKNELALVKVFLWIIIPFVKGCFLFLRFCFGPFWVGHLHAAPWVAAAALRAACTSSWCCWWLGLQLQQFVVMLLILARAFCLILALLCQQGAILVVPPVAVAIPLVPICQGVCGTHPQVDPFVKG